MGRITKAHKISESPSTVAPADRTDKYYISYCSKKGYKNARKKAGIHHSPAWVCSHYCCWHTVDITKKEIERFPRYLRHGFEYGPESYGFKKHGDPNRIKFRSKDV